MAVPRRGKKWCAAVDLPQGADGERRQTCRVFDTRHAAEDWEAEVRSRVAGGGYADPRRLTVGEYLNPWLDAVSPSLKPNAVANCGVVSGR